jgi:predicted DNA-binding antitoxin AbrB/MazE fold protein
MFMRIRAVYGGEVLRPLEKLGLREKEEILIEIKKHRISKGVLKVDPGLVDEVIENEELFE